MKQFYRNDIQSTKKRVSLHLEWRVRKLHGRLSFAIKKESLCYSWSCRPIQDDNSSHEIKKIELWSRSFTLNRNREHSLISIPTARASLLAAMFTWLLQSIFSWKITPKLFIDGIISTIEVLNFRCPSILCFLFFDRKSTPFVLVVLIASEFIELRLFIFSDAALTILSRSCTFLEVLNKLAGGCQHR